MFGAKSMDNPSTSTNRCELRVWINPALTTFTTYKTGGNSSKYGEDKQESFVHSALKENYNYNLNMKNKNMSDTKINSNYVYPLVSSRLIFDSENKCTNAFLLCSHPEILKLSYNMIKSNPGNMVHGSDRETLDGISESWFLTTSGLLRKEAFEFRPVRRVYIPKSNGKMRPIGISSPRDKIIQQSLKIVLEIILNPKFYESSHGFRPRCHTALR